MVRRHRPFGIVIFYFAAARRQPLPFQKPDRPVPFIDTAGPAWPTATQSVAAAGQRAAVARTTGAGTVRVLALATSGAVLV